MPVKIQIFTEYKVSVILHCNAGEYYGPSAPRAKKHKTSKIILRSTRQSDQNLWHRMTKKYTLIHPLKYSKALA